MGTGLMDMGTGMAPDMEMPICTRTRDIHIRVPAGYTHTRVKHYLYRCHNDNFVGLEVQHYDVD